MLQTRMYAAAQATAGLARVREWLCKTLLSGDNSSGSLSKSTKPQGHQKAQPCGLVDFLVSEKGLKPYDAYTLLSLAGDVRVSRTFRPISPVKMMLSRRALEQLG